MPTYEYRCSNCGTELEIIQSIKADALTHCDNCGKETLKRIISGGNALIFKGSGFYLTDYKNKSVDPASTKKESTSETKEKSSKETNTKTGEPSSAPKKTETKTETKSESKSDSSKTTSTSSSTSKKSSEK